MTSYPVASIDLAALQHNLNHIKQLAPNSQVISVIKANAYGHGTLEVAKALDESDAFAVARLSEGMQLRRAGIKHKIVLLEGVTTVEELQLAADYDLSLVFHHQSQIELLEQTDLVNPLSFCWLMIETGMHRLGFSVNDADEVLAALETSKAIVGPVGLMSHFANADLVDDPRNQQQMTAILAITEDDHSISMANSAAILSFPVSHQQWLRPGLMLYGVSPFADKTAADLDLKPVMQLKSVLTAIQNIEAGEQVGYGGDWTATKDTLVGTVSIGYGDGYSRQLSNVGQVSINGKLVEVLGRISMDMICIDLQASPSAKIGDEVVLWGNEQLSVELVAKLANTIPYELMCQVSTRVAREYHYGQS
ncbi:alanine racemase [Methylophaga sp. 42_25_T18]|mgnify:CR=1 FL=1|nr:alanine racemase [Methylophaga sp. 42_25_T18]OUR88963.1 alanine racemase [Methylophaga sp. 42_8_T64]